jgi:hypothetical protein
MLWLASLAFSVQSTDVTGLRAGEAAVVVDASGWFDPNAQGQFLHPRVLDANTGAPLAGVVIETWTEMGVEPTRDEVRLDMAITGRDGTARVRFVEGEARADKVRLSKPGYASCVVSSSDAFHDEVRLYTPTPFTGRVLDLEGLPVAGALVRTRETCAHAVPATQTRTDALGRFEMQDFPPLADGVPEVEVVELHHGSLYQLESADLIRQRSTYGALDLYVARQRPVMLELIDAHGEPLVGRHVTTKEAPVTHAWTGKDGRCTLLPSLSPYSGTYFLCDSPGESEMLVAIFVDGLVSRVTPGMGEGVDKSGRLTVRIEGVGEGELPPPIVIVPATSGFISGSSSGESLELPRGSARVYVGGDFTGWRREVREVAIRETPQEIVFAPRREPRVTVTSNHWKELTRFIAQAGDHSDPNSAAVADGETRFISSVPAGQPITIFAEFDDGAVRRASLLPLDGDASVDLDAESNLVRSGVPAATEASCALRFTVCDAAGKDLEGAMGRLYASNPTFDSADGAKGPFTWPMPAHATYRTAFEAPGYTRVYREGITPAKGEVAPFKIVLTQRARLVLRGNVREVDVGGVEPESTADGIVLDVAAGPLTLCVQRNEKPELALDLTLAPGETRVLDVR